MIVAFQTQPETAGPAAPAGGPVAGPYTSPTKGERTRERLIHAARRVFGSRGYRGTRMADIAKAAGLSEGAVYRYFRNKDDVFRIVLDQFMREALLASRGGGLLTRHPEEAILAANTSYLRVYWENRGLIRALREAAAGQTAYQRVWEEMRRPFRERFLYVLETHFGQPPTRETELLVLALQCSIEEFAYLNFVEAVGPGIHPPVTVDEAARITSRVWVSTFRNVLMPD